MRAITASALSLGILGGAILIGMYARGGPAHADTTPSSAGTITVTGHADKMVQPDMAVINAGATSRATTAKSAEQKNDAIMAKLLSALKTDGVASSDIQTQWYNVNPIYNQTDNNGTSTISGFEASNTISVQVHALNKVGTILDSLIKAGANQIGGVNYEVSNANQLQETLYSQALDDAKSQATSIASKIGATITGVQLVDTTGGSGNPIVYATGGMAAAASSAVVSPGTQDISTSVKVIYTVSGGQ